jgi:hypothetical protein
MKRITLRLSDEAHAAAKREYQEERKKHPSIDGLYSFHDFLLERINGRTLRDLMVYGREELRHFSEAELNLIRDACNGHGMSVSLMGAVNASRGIALNVYDSIRLNRYDKKWDVDEGRVMSKINALSPVGLLALQDDILRFWGEITPGADVSESEEPAEVVEE